MEPDSDTLALIKEIDRLWEPVYPYLALHIEEVYGRTDGHIMEIGPFCGVITSMCRNKIGASFTIASFPAGLSDFFRRETAGADREISVLDTDPGLTGVPEESIDLAIFRGAFFFPGLFSVDFPALLRILTPGGTAFVGGGYGRFTPLSVIREIGVVSRDLNLRIGKIERTEEEIGEEIAEAGIETAFTILREGGLWITMKKK